MAPGSTRAPSPSVRQCGMAVHLTKIYTRTGDDGTTALGDMSRVPKTDVRLVAYADVDEANSAIGVAIALGELPADIVSVLTRIQNEMFDLGADLCTPIVAAPEFPALRVTTEYVDELERACDHYNEGLVKLSSFILPGGSAGSALLHVARTATRRAERSAWSLRDAQPDVTTPETTTYLNRLSDLLFILARVANGGDDVRWTPGGERPSPG